MRCLIAGCGDVGTELGRLLTRENHEVWGLRRRPQGLPAPIRPLAADLAAPDTLRDLPEHDILIYTAAADRHDEEAYRGAYVDGARNLLRALEAEAKRPRHLFFTSSTGVYGQNQGEWIDESSPTEPRSFTGKILLEAERIFLENPLGATVVRLAGIYGPGRTRLIDEIRSGRARLFPETSFTNRIHRDDGAGFLARLIAMVPKGTPPEEIYIGVDDDPASRSDVFRWLADRLGVPRPPTEAEPFQDGRDRRGKNKRCRNARLRSTGYRLRFPSFRDGYSAILDEL